MSKDKKEELSTEEVLKGGATQADPAADTQNGDTPPPASTGGNEGPGGGVIPSGGGEG